MNMILDVTDDSVNEVLGGELTVLQFTAPWCGPCRMVSPIIEELAMDNPDIKVGKLNIDENPNSARDFGIRSIPAIMFFKNGELVDKMMGAQPKANYQEKLDSIK